jgi:thioesterase domain-containing protein
MASAVPCNLRSLQNTFERATQIYGIQGKGSDEIEEPLERVEDMARFYLDAIEELYPQGPYILIGYSFGGLVALEMAQRFSETGKNVALLVLIDAYPHPRYMAYPQRLRLFGTRVRVMLTRCGSSRSQAHLHTLFVGLNADCIFPDLSMRKPGFLRDAGPAVRRGSSPAR